MEFHINSKAETESHILSRYEYHTTEITKEDEIYNIHPSKQIFDIKTEKKVPKTGLMLVGLGGNNGTTVAAGILANKLNVQWETKEGLQRPNYYGSVTQSSTIKLGTFEGKEIYIPFNKILPMLNPNDIVIGGWDINGASLGQAMRRAKVLDKALQDKLFDEMEKLKPLKGVFDPSFIAPNQLDRVDNAVETKNKKEIVEIFRKDIRDFKAKNNLEKVIVLWTANTERYCAVRPGLNTSEAELLKSLEENASEIAPSTLYALACLFERTPFINGSPQNTFVPGLIEMAVRLNVPIGGDDFKSGQTKLKSVLVDFLVGAGIKPKSIVSYNHLGNNDGKNLDYALTFKSKEISKSDVVNDLISSNEILYKDLPAEKPDHCIVIKYIPYVGDSKKAMDEYTSEIFLNGKNTLVIHNTCEDSLLAAPIIIDMCIVMELLTRIEIKKEKEEKFDSLHPIASFLSYFAKAPLVPSGTPCVNSLARQKAMLENFLRACVGLAPENNILLEFKTKK